MYALPPLLLDQVAMRLDGDDRIEFCQQHEAYFFGDFEVSISAKGTDDWQIDQICIVAEHTHYPTLGSGRVDRRKIKISTRLTGDLLGAAVAHFNDDRDWRREISDHVAEHLRNEDDAAANEAYEFAEAL